MTRAEIKGIFFALLATLLWASQYPVGRVLLGQAENSYDPFWLSLIRFFFAVVFFIPLIAFSSERRSQIPVILRKDWKIMLWLALVGVIAEGILVFISTKYTTAARASLLANAAPVFTVIAAWLIYREKITAKILSGMIIGFAGITLAMFSQGEDAFLQSGAGTFAGDTLALTSGICWAIYTVCGTRVVREYDTWVITLVIYVMGVLMMPFVLLAFHSRIELCMPWNIWAGAAYLGLFACGLAACCWFLALKFIPASKLGSFGYLSAICTIFISCICLKESISFLFIVAAVTALSGMSLMLKK